MNDQVQAVLALCDGHQAELNRIHEAEAQAEQRHQMLSSVYQAELVDCVLKQQKIHFVSQKYLHDPAGIISDEMNEEDHQELITVCLNYKAGRMSAERAMEILAERVDSALLMAGEAYAEAKVGA